MRHSSPALLVQDWNPSGVIRDWSAEELTLGAGSGGTEVTLIKEQVGGVDMTAFNPGAAHCVLSTIGSRGAPAVLWPASPGISLFYAVVADAIPEGAIACVVQMPSTGAAKAMAAASIVTGPVPPFDLIMMANDASIDCHRRSDLVGSCNATMASGYNAVMDLLFTWNASGAQLYINGALANSNAVATTNTSVDQWAIGTDMTGAARMAYGMKWYNLRCFDEHKELADSHRLHNWRVARVGI